MTRNQKFALYLALAIVGGIGIGLSTFLVIGRIHNAAPDTARIVAGTLVVTLAMVWACFFTVRAHYMQDEFRRQRETSAGYWGGWLGIAASAPIFFFIAIGGLGIHPATPVHPSIIFTAGYVLAPVCGAIGAVGTRVWLYYRDR